MTVKVQCSHRQLSALFPPLTFPAGVGVLHQRPRTEHLAQTAPHSHSQPSPFAVRCVTHLYVQILYAANHKPKFCNRTVIIDLTN